MSILSRLVALVSNDSPKAQAAKVIPCLTLVLLGLVTAAARVDAINDDASVRTVAGSGTLGIQDGPSEVASFLVPTGIARGADGTIYVSDEAAQRIRSIKDGQVRTVAGSGLLGTLGMSVVGGFKDGPALSAQFDHPMGLAIAHDGRLFIADAKNKAVRALARGVVTTVIKEGLVQPEGLAFDKAGILWIADYGGGIKRWDGRVLISVPLPNMSAKALAVSISPDPDTPTLVVSTFDGIYEYSLSAASHAPSQPYTRPFTSIIPAQGDYWTFGYIRQLVAIGKHQVIYSDPVTNTIRFLRFNVLPYASQPYSGIIAGGTDYKGINNAGFADGEDARFYAPRGLLINGDSILVADAGNRRIRQLPLPQFRTQEYAFEDAEPYDDRHFEIAFVGPSTAFWDSHDDNDSICGALERSLNTGRMLGKPARCHAHRIDAAKPPQVFSYIQETLSFRHVDLFIIESSPRQVDDNFVTAAKELSGSTKAQILLVWYPEFGEVSDGEDLELRQEDYMGFPDESSASRAAIEHAAEVLLAGIPRLSIYDLLPDEVQYEKDHNLPLYLSPNSHMNARGNRFVGDHIAEALVSKLHVVQLVKPADSRSR